MKFSTALAAFCVCAAPAPAWAVELFIFRSEGMSAVTLDREGAKLPASPKGWKFIASLGDHSAFLDGAGVERVRAAGFEIYEDKKPSKKVEDWVGMPRGSFRITKRAAAQIRRYYQHVVERTGKPQVLTLQYGPVSVKPNDSAQWRDLGDRITLGSYDAVDVPKAAVRRYDGVPLLFQMKPEQLPTPRPRVIDYNEGSFVFAK